MNKRTSLVIVESIRDSVSLRRQKNLLSDKRFRQDYLFSYVFCVEPEDLLHVDYPQTPEIIIRDAGRFGQKLPLHSIKIRLFCRLLAQIRMIQPQYIIVYRGFIYNQYSKDIKAVLSKIHEQHPTISIGMMNLQPQFKADPDPIYSQDDEVALLQNRLATLMQG